VPRLIDIDVHKPNVLRLLGSLYRSPVDAIKEYVSNTLDRWLELRRAGEPLGPCTVAFRIDRREVVIEGDAPGMTEDEFVDALRRVADSRKQQLGVPQIGRLGIGIFAFNQIGRKATFLSRRSAAGPTCKFVLREDSGKAEQPVAKKSEELPRPGLRIAITELKFDPTRPRGPLAPEKLQRAFAEKFDTYLRRQDLRILVGANGATAEVRPRRITLPRVGEGYRSWPVCHDPARTLTAELYFDPGGRGRVGVRHAGVVVIEDLGAVDAYALPESVFASGFVTGCIDADFLKPLPARTEFDQNQDWLDFVDELAAALGPSVQAEVDELRRQDTLRRFGDVHRKALELARDIFDLEDFRDLELPSGLKKRKAAAPKKGERAGDGEPLKREPAEPPREPGTEPAKGPRFSVVERAFEDGAGRHARFREGFVEINTLNPDYLAEMRGGEAERLGYVAMMIGKQTIAQNDAGGQADDYLEKFLSFFYRLKHKVPRAAGRRPRGRPPAKAQGDLPLA